MTELLGMYCIFCGSNQLLEKMNHRKASVYEKMAKYLADPKRIMVVDNTKRGT